MVLTAKGLEGKRYALVRARDEALGVSHALTDPEPIRAHLAYLHGLGFSRAAIGSARGITENAVDQILLGKWGRIRGVLAHQWLQVTPQTIFMTAPDHVRVASYATLRRYQALQWLGHTKDMIEAIATRECGVHIWPQRLPRDPRIEARADRAMRVVYRQLHLTTGTSTQTAAKARTKGYLPPLAWDDIDDPNEHPATVTDPTIVDEVAIQRAIHGDPVNLTPTERAIVVQCLTDQKVGADDIAQRLGVTSRTINRIRRDLRESAA